MAIPVVAAVAAALSGPVLASILRTFGLWFIRVMLMKLLFSFAGLLVSVAVVEFMPRLLGLGQGLISWFWQVGAVGVYDGFVSALAFVGVQLPNFKSLLSSLPPEVIWVGSVMRVHKVAYILVSIPLFNLVISVMHKIANVAAGASLAIKLLSFGKGV